MAAVSLVPARAILPDTCEWEQLCCCHLHPTWCCLSLWIYVVILASLKRKFFFVYFVIVSNSGLFFLSLNLLPLSKLFKPITLSSHFFHLILPLISSSPVSDEEIVHIWGSPSQGWKQRQSACRFLGLQHIEGKEFLQNETWILIHLPSHAVPVPFEHSYDIWPGLQLLCGKSDRKSVV